MPIESARARENIRACLVYTTERLKSEGADRSSSKPAAADRCVVWPTKTPHACVEPWHQGTVGALRGSKHTAWEGAPRAGDRAASPDVLPALYHLRRDPGEQYNVADEHPEVVRRTRSRMERLAKELSAEPSADATE